MGTRRQVTFCKFRLTAWKWIDLQKWEKMRPLSQFRLPVRLTPGKTKRELLGSGFRNRDGQVAGAGGREEGLGRPQGGQGRLASCADGRRQPYRCKAQKLNPDRKAKVVWFGWAQDVILQVESHFDQDEPATKKAAVATLAFQILHDRSVPARQYAWLKRYKGGKRNGAWRPFTYHKKAAKRQDNVRCIWT